MINQREETVTPANDYQLVIRFTNAEEKVFDMKPYLDKGVFKALRDDFFLEKPMYVGVPLFGMMMWTWARIHCTWKAGY